MTEQEELEAFRAWKRARDKNQLEEIFFQIESSLNEPSSRGFSPRMPGEAYRLLATGLMLLKKELILK